MGAAGFAIYVHVPFCTVKCGYCDFNAYAGMDSLKAAYADALLAELRSWRPALPDLPLASIGFGGGTPGEFPASDIGRVISLAAAYRPLAAGAEVSLEANPGTSTLRGLAAFRAAGVTRITFGAQSFDRDELRFLERIHSPEATAASVRNARAAGFTDVGLDLIYGLPGQNGDGWRENLDRAIDLGPDHISCYALTVEPGTLLAAKVARGEVIMPDQDSVADLYEIAAKVLDASGYHQYELSNWAREGHESRHNLAYWTDRPYLGIGAGAHGYIGGVRYENLCHPRKYIAACRALPPHGRDRVRAGGVIAAVHQASGEASMVDFVALRLRLVAGLAAGEFEARFGRKPADVFGPALDQAVDAGLLDVDEAGLRLTRRGRLLHGEVVARLMALAEGVRSV